MAKLIYSKDPEKFIINLAEALKKIPEFKAPEWVVFVKTGASRERPPINTDFWYFRAASILRQLYIKGVLGVGKLRTRYGSRKDQGGRPDKFVRAGGKIIRVILQQAEAAGLVEKVNKMQHGRRLTTKGRDFLDSIEVDEKAPVNLENIKIAPVEIAAEDTDVEEDVDEEVEEIIDEEEEKSDGE